MGSAELGSHVKPEVLMQLILLSHESDSVFSVQFSNLLL